MFIEAYNEGYFEYKGGYIYRKKVWDNKRKIYVDLEEPTLASRATDRGYRRIHFKGYSLYEHTCVFSIFHGISELEKHESIDHIDCNKGNNRIENLEGVTVKENTQRASDKGLIPRTYGEINGMSKLKKEEIREIKIMYERKEYNQYEIAEKFGISQSHVSSIINGKRWNFDL